MLLVMTLNFNITLTQGQGCLNDKGIFCQDFTYGLFYGNPAYVVCSYDTGNRVT